MHPKPSVVPNCCKRQYRGCAVALAIAASGTGLPGMGTYDRIAGAVAPSDALKASDLSPPRNFGRCTQLVWVP